MRAFGKVVHFKKSRYDVYVGRPSKFGNPFVEGRDGTREEVVEKFRRHLESRPDLVLAARRELRGKVLGCWCFPKRPCHAEVLCEVANADLTEDEEALLGL